MRLDAHDFANLFPLIEGDDFAALCEDVREHGVLDQIVILDGKILDGRNRYNVLVFLCESGEVLGAGWGHRAGEALDPDHLLPDHAWFRKFNRSVDGDPLSWVLSKNLKRRHLDESQRAMVGAKLATLRAGRPVAPAATEAAPLHIPDPDGLGAQAAARNPANLPDSRITQADAAKLLNVSERSIRAAKAVQAQGAPELQKAVEQGEIAVSAAEKIARLPMDVQTEAVAKALPNGARALMGSRQEPDDSLDYFPTPPWATRALIRHVLPTIGVTRLGRVREPSCGEGHMSGVLLEYEQDVIATDIHDYSVDGVSPPGWAGAQDFLADNAETDADWFVANPPFGDKAEQFTLKMIAHARRGVAIFARVQWLDTIGRYERIFSQHPPTLMAFFAERVPLVKGRWDPHASTATAYMWLVWVRDVPRLPPMWIPPGRREALSYADDVARFTAHPVMPFVRADESLLAKWSHAESAQQIAPLETVCCQRDAGTAEIIPLPDEFRIGSPAPQPIPARADDGLDIPAFLRRGSGIERAAS